MYQIALDTIQNIMFAGAYSNIAINEKITAVTLAEQPIFTKVVKGTVEKWLYLEYWLAPLTKGKRQKPFIKCALRLMLYMLKYTNVAPHHVINSIVGVVKKRDFKASQFVNALGRQMVELAKPDLASLPMPERIAIETSTPQALVDFLFTQYGSKTLDILANYESSHYNCYRINTLKTDAMTVLKALNLVENEYTIDQTTLWSQKSLVNTPAFQNGLIIAQDWSSQQVALVMNPAKHSYILDACSAPGMKTAHLAALLDNNGTIIALDIHEHKLALMAKNFANLGVNCVKIEQADSSAYTPLSLCDQVLIDAPCSGLGVIGRKVDLKYHFDENNINELVGLQRSLLAHLAPYVKMGGYLTYSTCTLNKYENEEQVKWFCEAFAFQIIEEKLFLPTAKNDGFYLCKMQRSEK